jgi:hypothetical protein
VSVMGRKKCIQDFGMETFGDRRKWENNISVDKILSPHRGKL